MQAKLTLRIDEHLVDQAKHFKHIVNLQRIRGYNSVNLRRGYPLLEIRSPREVLKDE